VCEKSSSCLASLKVCCDKSSVAAASPLTFDLVVTFSFCVQVTDIAADLCCTVQHNSLFVLTDDQRNKSVQTVISDFLH